MAESADVTPKNCQRPRYKSKYLVNKRLAKGSGENSYKDIPSLTHYLVNSMTLGLFQS